MSSLEASIQTNLARLISQEYVTAIGPRTEDPWAAWYVQTSDGFAFSKAKYEVTTPRYTPQDFINEFQEAYWAWKLDNDPSLRVTMEAIYWQPLELA